MKLKCQIKVGLGFFLAALVFSAQGQAAGWRKLNVAAGTCGTEATYFNAVAIPSPSAIYLVGGGPILGGPGIICKSTDGGNNWVTQDIPTADPIYAIDCADTMRCFAAGADGHILKTFNGGDDWSMVTLEDSRPIFPGPGPNPTFWGIDVINVFGPLQVIAVGDYGDIWRTTNGGTSWTLLSGLPGSGIAADFQTFLTHVYFPDSSIGYITGYNETVLKSSGGGASWEPLDLPPTAVPGSSFDSVFARSGAKVWIQGNVDIIRSDDGGVGWGPYVMIAPGPPNIPFVDNFFISDTEGFTVGGPGGGVIRKSLDGGSTWPNFFPGVTDPSGLSAEDQQTLEDITVRDSEGTLLTLFSHLKDISCSSPNFCLAVGEDQIILRRDQSVADLVPSDGWSLACANSSGTLHIIAGVRNQGDGFAVAPFQVKLESLDAGGAPIAGASRIYTMSSNVGPNEFATVNTTDLSSAELYNLFNPVCGENLTIRMTVDSNITAERPNGDVSENPEGGEANNVRSQTTSCGPCAAAAGAGGGGAGGEKKFKKGDEDKMKKKIIIKKEPLPKKRPLPKKKK